MKTQAMWLSGALVVAIGAACGKPAPEALDAADPGNVGPAAQAPATAAPVIAVPGAAPGTNPAPQAPAPTPADAATQVHLPVPPPAPADAPADPASSVAAPSDPMFTMRLTHAGAVAVGQVATAKVTILPGKGYKVNKEFPASVQLEAHPALAFASPRLERAAALVDNDHELTFGVQMSANAAGDFVAKGLMKFAVCDDANCVPKKQAIALDLHVK